ncbi:MAG: DUF58 domain-containing protein [Planctomycetes bacterium]|nr:DUF58 domain-containing protein [Planctomycetota bacterium]
MWPSGLTESLKPETIERLRQLELFSRLRVEGMLTGDNRSTLKGFSTEFVSHRPYFPGDELRRVDWRAYARSERLVIKEFEEPTNLTAAVALDVSGSMDFGDDELTKHEYSVRCAALVLYLLYLQHDSFGLFLFGDQLRRTLPPRSSRRHLMGVLAALAEARPEGETSLETALRQIQTRFKRRGLLVLISDCMAEPDHVSRVLSRFRSQGTDVIVFQVVHPDEREFPYNQVSRFTCLETHQADNVDPFEIRNAYRERFRMHTGKLKAELLRRDMDHCELTVTENYEKILGDYLSKRAEILM